MAQVVSLFAGSRVGWLAGALGVGCGAVGNNGDLSMDSNVERPLRDLRFFVKDRDTQLLRTSLEVWQSLASSIWVDLPTEAQTLVGHFTSLTE